MTNFEKMAHISVKHIEYQIKINMMGERKLSASHMMYGVTNDLARWVNDTYPAGVDTNIATLRLVAYELCAWLSWVMSRKSKDKRRSPKEREGWASQRDRLLPSIEQLIACGAKVRTPLALPPRPKGYKSNEELTKPRKIDL